MPRGGRAERTVWRARVGVALAAWAVVLSFVGPALGQTGVRPGAPPRRGGGPAVRPVPSAPAALPPAKPATPSGGGEAVLSDADAALEEYLSRPGLKPLLAEHLSLRLAAAQSGAERTALAERLGKLYVELLAAAVSDKDRESWENKAKELIRAVPEAPSLGLRLDLARTEYLRAENAAERWRLRLIGDEQRGEAESLLRSLRPRLEGVAGEAGRRVEFLARSEELGRGTDSSEQELAEARRVKSAANYYAGWSAYYQALLSKNAVPAGDALAAFAVILTPPAAGGGGGSGGAIKTPAADKIPKGLLKFDHVARAAIGCALAYSVRGDDVRAIAWLDTVEADEDVPQEVKASLPARRIAVLAAAKRWADLERFVAVLRGTRGVKSDGKGPRPLEAALARLLAVSVFEGDRGAAPEVLGALSQIAMSDLISRGEVAQVLDLAQRFGSAPLGDSGFIAIYVRGMQRFSAASDAAKQAGLAGDAPATEAALVNAFRLAAETLESATRQSDATGAAFAGERAKALLTAGRAHFRAGDLAASAERFAAAAEAKDPQLAEEALWLAVLAMDKAASAAGASSDLGKRRDELATLFVRRFPQAERAASLLLKRLGSAELGDEDAVKVLLAVGRDTAVYDAARRQAARLLYRLFRAASENDRPFAAARFATVGEEVLEIDRREASATEAAADSAAGAPGVSHAGQAAERAILTARQLLDAVLSGPTPDPGRAEAILATLKGVALATKTDIAAYTGELLFRQMQIVLARDDTAGAEALAKQLRAASPALADSADRLLFQRALARYKRTPMTPVQGEPTTQREARIEVARSLISAGLRIIDRVAPSAESLRDAGLMTVYRQTAAAGQVLAIGENDAASRDVVIRLDRVILLANPASRESLERLAQLSEAAGDQATARDAWARLSAVIPEGESDWFRARAEFLRLLAESDREAAAVALAQLWALHPDLGPMPYREQLKRLMERVGPPSATPSAVPGGAPSAPARNGVRPGAAGGGQ